MANNRELSQLASLIVVDDTTRNIGIATTGFSNVGIGTTFPEGKFHVYDDNQNSNTYSSQVYRTSTNFSNGVGHRAYYESYYTTAGVQTSYASGINVQVSASVAAGSTNNGYVRAALDRAWRNNNNAQSSTDNGTLNILYGRGIQYGHYNASVVSPITNTATGLYLTPYCLTGSIGTLIGIDINSVETSVGATATNVYGINCGIDTTDGTNSYNLYISGNANNYFAGSVGIGTSNPTSTLQVGAASTQAFYVFSDGRVGIGQTNPDGVFAARDSSGTSGFSSIIRAEKKGTSDTNVFRVDIDADTNEVQLIGTGNQASNISIVNGTNTTAYFKVGGNVGIGTTNPTSKLHVIGDVLVTGITTSTDFNSSSDINLKDNIERIQNPIDKLQQLDGVTFNWKETHRASVGVIAQQVEKVLPQLVSGDETKTVNYNGLIALLIECVKEQQIEINNLKEKLK